MKFISYNIAFSFFKQGFDEPCLKYSWNDKKVPQWMSGSSRPTSLHTQCYWTEEGNLFTVSIPTYQQVTDWLRDNHNVNIYAYQPNESGYWANSLENKAKYDSYYEALTKGVEQAINALKIK